MYGTTHRQRIDLLLQVRIVVNGRKIAPGGWISERWRCGGEAGLAPLAAIAGLAVTAVVLQNLSHLVLDPVRSLT